MFTVSNLKALLIFLLFIFILSACGWHQTTLAPEKISTLPAGKIDLQGHLDQKQINTVGAQNSGNSIEQIDSAKGIPDIVINSASNLKTNKPQYLSVVVTQANVSELLMKIANDLHLQLDFHPEVTGRVNINAIKQSLPIILQRICRQVNASFRLENDKIHIFPDRPYLYHYSVPYVNIERTMKSSITALTSISSEQSNLNNATATRIETTNKNNFWLSLEKSIKDLLRETDKVLPAGSAEGITNYAVDNNKYLPTSNQQNISNRNKSARNRLNNPNDSFINQKLTNGVNQATTKITNQGEEATVQWQYSTYREAASVIIHPESGIISVRATSEQHEKISEFIKLVVRSAERQVIIEATIIEVNLSDAYRQGIEWSRFRSDGSGFSVVPAATTGTSTTQPFVIRAVNKSSPLDLTGLISLLQSFGQTRVLSSPRISVLNNQTALMKVVENFVYFNVKADIVSNSNTSTTLVTTEPNSVAVGLIMSVTPFIAADGMITLNIRPSISSVTALKADPNPSIPSSIKNYVPQIRTREIESILRLADGEIALLGGLMEDYRQNETDKIPLIADVPVVGEIFTSRDNAARKSELVILLRPHLQER